MSLRDAGLVISTRGSHGGYELSRSPETIPMIAVLRALEGPIAPMICATDEPEPTSRLRPDRALHRQLPVDPHP